ncbi:hypothetical protein P8C59_005679 [Phyllachora maydis]|uniref:Uncharacterized protein n=1 Tax=Phyllachora maydis TaxID=1825666 RepID=A0AAD9I4S4_9PEZI|nr:hypothetical protein P8C59_005679 [Phyllachora maydis]
MATATTATVKVNGKPKLAVTTPRSPAFPRDLRQQHTPAELRSALSDHNNNNNNTTTNTKTPLSAISRTSAFRDPIPSAGLPSAGLPSARSGFSFSFASPASACFFGFGPSRRDDDGAQRTPISPPTAYLDFLKSMTPASPASSSGATDASCRCADGAAGPRQVREVVTRTVTYTPRMGPAPKGKRRKVDHETAVES